MIQISNLRRGTQFHVSYPYCINKTSANLDSRFNGIWQKKYSKEQLEKRVRYIRETNLKLGRKLLLPGKPSLVPLVKDHGLKILKRPILFSGMQNGGNDPESHRDDVMEMLKAKLDRTKSKSFQYSFFILQAYQSRTFFGKKIRVFYGLYLSEDPLKKKVEFVNEYFVKDSTNKWTFFHFHPMNPVKATEPHELEIELASWLLDFVPGRFELMLGFYIDKPKDFDVDEMTGANYNSRLRKYGIFNILRIPDKKACIPYRKGMDLSRLPVYSAEDIEK